ncbi:hypothetical protein ABKN59_011288 [Abortiporus biennis]
MDHLPPLWFSVQPNSRLRAASEQSTAHIPSASFSGHILEPPSTTKPTINEDELSSSSTRSDDFADDGCSTLEIPESILDRDEHFYDYGEDRGVEESIRFQFSGKVRKQYPVMDFVRRVWKYTQPIPSGNYDIPVHLVEHYCKPPGSSYDDPSTRSRKSSLWLVKILTHLYDALPNNNLSHASQFINVIDVVRYLESTSGTESDEEESRVEDDISEEIWQGMGAFIKVDIGNGIEFMHTGQSLPIELSLLSESEDEYNASISEEMYPLNGKNSREDTSTEICYNIEDSDTYMTSDELYDAIQTLKCAAELQSHGIRHYSTGIIFDHEHVSFWYIDHMGVIKSKPFNFLLQPHYLLLCVAALKYASLSQLGISPFLDYSNQIAKFGEYKEVYVNFPRALDEAGKPVSKADMDMLRFQVDDGSLTGRKPYTTGGIIGMGTIKIPLVRKQKSGLGLLQGKLSWPLESRTSEDHFLWGIWKKLRRCAEGKKVIENIARVVSSLSLDRDDPELGLPRGSMEFFLEQDPPRIFRLLVFVGYEPLSNVESPAEFEKVFRDVITAHHYVYTIANILHRNICISSIAFYRTDDEKVVGILRDWELAIEVNKDALAGEEASQYLLAGVELRSQDIWDSTILPTGRNTASRGRNGFVPFMALDLLSDDKKASSIHLYRHDLESFFYVFVWFCATFDPEEFSTGAIIQWVVNIESDSDVYFNKERFLNDYDEYHRIIDNVNEEYRSFTHTISRLRRMFSKIRRYSKELRLSLSNRQYYQSHPEEMKRKLKRKAKMGYEYDDEGKDPRVLRAKLEKWASFETFMKQMDEQESWRVYRSDSD